MSAFLLALALASPNAVAADAVPMRWEIILFFASLPLWALLFRLHGLYDHDEERTVPSTVDDVFAVSPLSRQADGFVPGPTLRPLLEVLLGVAERRSIGKNDRCPGMRAAAPCRLHEYNSVPRTARILTSPGEVRATRPRRGSI